jgi:hypothetical protein
VVTDRVTEMEPSNKEITLQALRLRVSRLRYELGCLGTSTGLGLPVVVVACGLLSCMVAAFGVMVGGLLDVFAIAAAGTLGIACGAATACILMPVFDGLTAAHIVEAEKKLEELKKSLMAQKERDRFLQESAARKAEQERRAVSEELSGKTAARPATAHTRGWGSSPVCWYCRQPLRSTCTQCCYCQMLNTSRAA